MFEQSNFIRDYRFGALFKSGNLGYSCQIITSVLKAKSVSVGIELQTY